MSRMETSDVTIPGASRQSRAGVGAISRFQGRFATVCHEGSSVVHWGGVLLLLATGDSRLTHLLGELLGRDNLEAEFLLYQLPHGFSCALCRPEPAEPQRLTYGL